MKNNNIKIENKLKECRLKAGLTQFDVMIKLGFRSTDRVSKWENGNGMPGVINLFKLAEIYKALPQDLYPKLTQISAQGNNNFD